MKELYTSPELELLYLVSSERIASDVGYNQDFGALAGNEDEGVVWSAGDIEIDLT